MPRLSISVATRCSRTSGTCSTWAITDAGLVPHVTLKSTCSRCGERKKLIDFRGVSTDVRGQGGQWLKADTERVCIDCEGESHLKTITRYFTLNDIEFVYKFAWQPPPASTGANAAAPAQSERREITRIFVDGSLVGRIDYREEGRNYVARTYFDEKAVKIVAYFALGDEKPRETFLGDTRKEAKAYFNSLAKRCNTNTHQLALILSDLFLFPNPYQVSDIFGLDE